VATDGEAEKLMFAETPFETLSEWCEHSSLAKSGIAGQRRVTVSAHFSVAGNDFDV